MKNLNTNVRDADSNTTKHRFPWKWRLSDLKDVEKNGKKVFSCFSCGGGSTMGYKLAGYTVAGNAKGYVNEIIKAFKSAGYSVQIFLLDAQTMGVPQRRKRVFFIARRNDLNLPKLVLDFREKPIHFGEVRSAHAFR